MTALSAPRPVSKMGGHVLPELLTRKMKADAVLFNGALVCILAGFAVAASTATGLIADGIAEIPAPPGKLDNTGGADGDIEVRVRPGIFGFVNSGSDPIAQADVGKDCFIVDDQTVAKTNGGATRSRAGKVYSIEGGLVFVNILVPPGPGAAATPADVSLPTIQRGTSVLVAGVSAAIAATITSTSRIVLTAKDEVMSTALGRLTAKVADRTVGAPGSFVATSQKASDASTETGDVSTFDWEVIG